MNISFSKLLWLLPASVFLLAVAIPSDQAAAAASIKGTYVFEGKARAKGANGPQTKKIKGKMRVGLKSVTLQIPISVDGKVKTCKKMVRARFRKKLPRNPNRVSRRALFNMANCGNSTWTGTLRMKWLEHPEGYAVAFSLGGINDAVAADTVTARAKGSTGTLSTQANNPVPPPPPPVEE